MEGNREQNGIFLAQKAVWKRAWSASLKKYSDNTHVFTSGSMILRVRRCRKKQLGRVFATCKRDLKTEERRATLCDTLLDQFRLEHYGTERCPKTVTKFDMTFGWPKSDFWRPSEGHKGRGHAMEETPGFGSPPPWSEPWWSKIISGG